MKPPAFQFYADDFLAGTADMTAEEVGCYIRLLCHSWNKDGLDDNDRLALLAGQCQASSLAHAKTKFSLIGGKLRNTRQEKERVKQAEFRAKQAENGSKRWLGNAKPIALAIPSHEPDSCSPSPSPSPSPVIDAKTNNSGRKLPTLAEVITHGEFVGIPKETCEDFFHHFEAMGWVDKNGNPIMKWDSKLRGWKVKAQEANQVAKNGANLGADTFWKDKARLDILEKELAAIDARASHTAMEVHIQPQDKDRHTRLKTERRELKSKMKLL